MTVLEASNKLIEFFLKNDAFSIENDFNKICLISDTDADQAAVLAALDALTEQQLIIKKHFNKCDYWVLLQPLALKMQEVVLPITVAAEIANLINNFEPKDDTRCNPMNININDISNLLFLAKKTVDQKVKGIYNDFCV